MKHLVFYAPFINHGEFSKEAKLFAKCHGIPKKDVISVSTFQPLMLRRWRVLLELEKRQGQEYDAVVFFCHGRKHWLQLVGKEISIPALADKLGDMAALHLTVILYACSCAKKAGFAFSLSEELLDVDHTVVGHTTSGHTTMNPWVKNYSTMGRIEMFRVGSYWDKWKKNLKDEDGNFRFRFPFITQLEIQRELDSIE